MEELLFFSFFWVVLFRRCLSRNKSADATVGLLVGRIGIMSTAKTRKLIHLEEEPPSDCSSQKHLLVADCDRAATGAEVVTVGR